MDNMMDDMDRRIINELQDGFPVTGRPYADAAKKMQMEEDELIERLGKTPLLDLSMRLGEASGAALAVALLQAAVACHNGMATFAEAGVSDKD